MNVKVRTYSHDYPNDTMIVIGDEPWNNRIKLSLKFTSEDPDYGTDYLDYPDESRTIKFEDWSVLAQKLLDEIRSFLDKTDDGIHRSDAVINNLTNGKMLDNYSNTTLYAFENMLNTVINEEGKTNMESMHYDIGAKVKVDYDMTNLQNIATGNKFSVAKGQIGTIVKVNPCEKYDPERTAMYLIKFDNIPDKLTGETVTGWVPELDVSLYIEKKWYMTIAQAAEMIIREWRKDGKKVYSFCESDRYEAMCDPTKHIDNGGWFGIKQFDSRFDADSGEFNALVGYWGGGSLALAHVEEWEADDSMCEDVLRHAICKSTGWDADNYIYIEEEEEK